MRDIYVNFFNSDGLPRGAFTYGDLPPRDCTGLTSVAVQWLLIFFTPQGSDPLDPRHGTQFANLIGGNFSDPETLAEFVQIAVQQATEQVLRAQSEDLRRPSALRLATAELTDILAAGTEVQLTVRLQSQTGESVAAAFQVPRS